jgi:hypothetical protein
MNIKSITGGMDVKPAAAVEVILVLAVLLWHLLGCIDTHTSSEVWDM